MTQNLHDYFQADTAHWLFEDGAEVKMEDRIFDGKQNWRVGNFGSIKWRIYHREDCPDEFKEGEDVAGWEFYEHTVTVFDMTFHPIKARANIGPCLICGKLVVRIPLILFIDKGKKGQLDFCFGCAEERGILGSLIKGK